MENRKMGAGALGGLMRTLEPEKAKNFRTGSLEGPILVD
jgi:hypothetical protein